MGLIEKTYRENGSIVYRLPYHQAGPVHEPDAGLSIRFTPAPGSPWRPRPDEPEPTPPGVNPDTLPCQNRRLEPINEPTEESESRVSGPATGESVSAPLSPPLRHSKTPAPDSIPESWIPMAAELRPDLPVAIIERSAARFLDDRRSRGIELVDWLPAWKNWIRGERRVGKAPTGATSVGSPPSEPRRYANWLPGKPQGAAAISPEQAVAAFERDMRRLGAVKQPDGTWARPARPLSSPPTPAPLPRPLGSAAELATPVPGVTVESTPPPAPEKPRFSPLHGLLKGLREPAPAAGNSSTLPWRPANRTQIPTADELAEAEALLAAEIARKRGNPAGPDPTLG